MMSAVNTYIIQLYGTRSNWKRYTTHREWQECIYNELFNTYGQESQARKLYRVGDECDLREPDLQRKHINRQTNHVNRKVKSDCIACKGSQQGQIRAKGQKRSSLKETDGNKRKLRKKTRCGCKLCNIAICNNQYCWDFYNHIIEVRNYVPLILRILIGSDPSS